MYDQIQYFSLSYRSLFFNCDKIWILGNNLINSFKCSFFTSVDCFVCSASNGKYFLFTKIAGIFQRLQQKCVLKVSMRTDFRSYPPPVFYLSSLWSHFPYDVSYKNCPLVTFLERTQILLWKMLLIPSLQKWMQLFETDSVRDLRINSGFVEHCLETS